MASRWEWVSFTCTMARSSACPAQAPPAGSMNSKNKTADITPALIPRMFAS